MRYVIAPEPLTDLAAALLEAAGAPAAESRQVADHLVAANLCGHDSHGVQLIPRYAQHVETGLVRPEARPSLISDTGAVLRFDADDGFGVVVMDAVMEQAMARAESAGAAVFTVAHSHHIGRAGRYGEAAAAAGQMAIIAANVTDHDPMMAPHGGTAARFGTNPLCLAVPASDGYPEIVMDMATSAGAMGKVAVAAQAGTTLPEGWILDADGRPSTDPDAFFGPPQGTLLPFGGHKGYGLALIIELFTGLLSGGGTIQPGNPRRDGLVNNVFGLVVDPAAFGDTAWMRREAGALLSYVLGVAPQDPADPVITPGTPERETRTARHSGIPIAAGTWAALTKAADRLGVSMPDPRSEKTD